jgi:queuosine precursor transporter
MIPTILVSVAYVAAQMLADVASLRIVMFAGMSMDAGTLVYPLTFTLRDMVHKVAGVKVTRILILAAAVINVIMAGMFWLVSAMKPDMSVGLQAEFGMVLAPVWRITLASIVAEVFAELVDTEAYQFWVTKVTKRYQWMRVLISNAFSVPIDSLIFVWIAFGGVLPSAVIWSIFLSNVIVKGITTLVSLPGIYLVKERS